MAGGVLYQLSNYSFNSKNNYLEIDPEISFFKVVYRRHTRFAIENIILNDLTRTKLNYSEKIISKCNISRNADLLSNLYLTFELPNIYSGSYTNESYTSNYEFKWIENIGINICNYIKLNIDSNTIDSLTSDYINIWKELILSDDEKQIFNKNIGHIEELYDPKNGLGQNGSYPHITENDSSAKQSYKYYDNIILDNVSKSTLIFPSILSQKIKVPLPYSFFLNSGLSIPLIALQYSTLSLEFEMKQFKDLYTIIDSKYDSSSNSFNKRIKPSSETHHNIDNFTIDFNLNINPNVEGEYIFLDDDERKRFAMYDHEYLIEEPRLINKDGIEIKSTTEETVAKLYGAFNPTKYLVWVVKRDDFKHINEWSNYTNWIDPDIPPYSNQYFYSDSYYNLTSSKNVFYSVRDQTDMNDGTAHNNFFNTIELKKNILTNIKLEFDGNVRIDKNSDYFNKQQIYQHFKTNPVDGIYVYSFSLNPLDFQPSGNCNFSDIYNPKIYFKKQISSDNFSEYNHRAYIYVVSYNILLIKSGIGSLKFSN